jgi:predicted dehydrogenase
VRFGLLGTGYWAAETQAAGLVDHPDAELVAVWGRDPAKAAALAQRYGVTAYGDVDALLSEVDAVTMALPPDVQAPLAVRAARAGRHLLLDKPVALTVAAADEIVAAADQAAVASVVFFTNRFRPGINEFLAGLGRQDAARFTLAASIFHPDSPYAGSAWRREHGALWDVGPHALSVLLPVLGPVESVTAFAGPRDTTHALLRHAAGAVSTLTLTLDAPPDAAVFECSFHGDRVTPLPDTGGSPVDAYRTAVSELVHSGAGHPCGVRFGRDVVAVLAAVQEARDHGRVVRITGE